MFKDRFLGTDTNQLPLARELYEIMRSYPILSPHGHVDAQMLNENQPFINPVELLIKPDHYITRMLMSQGVTFDEIHSGDPRTAWKVFTSHWQAFRSTPSRIWMLETFNSLFEISDNNLAERPDYLYDQIQERLADSDFLPQSLFAKFGIEVLATTNATSDSLSDHLALASLDLGGRVIPTFRPDDVSDPEHPAWRSSLLALENSSGQECGSFESLMKALRIRRDYFVSRGATATDHGVLSARTINATQDSKESLFARLLAGESTPEDASTFRAIMLFEHARMASEDGLVMQLHPGSLRNYDASVFRDFGADKGFDIPLETHYVKELAPLLEVFGFNPNFRMVLFTLDESAYSRELAPLAGAYPSLRLGPPWWFHDSLNGMERWRESVTETAGFYNTVGFIDDTRAFCSIPVRHDVARRFDAGYLSREVARHRISKTDAVELAADIAYNLSKDFFRL